MTARPHKRFYLDFINYLQVIGIILVVLGHSFHEFPDGHHGSSLFIYRVCYSFHMPLFLFVSGFLLLFTTEVNLSNYSPSAFIVNKLKRLILPMIVLTAVTFVPRAFMSFAADDPFEFSVNSFFRAFIDPDFMPIPAFWFIQVSFTLLCLCFLIINIFKKVGISPLVTIFSIFLILLFYALSSLPSTTIFSISQLKRIGFFFALGGIYGLTFNKIDRFIPWTSPWFFFLALAVFCCGILKFEYSYFRFVIALLGIITTISLAKIIEKNNWKFLDHLTGANFIIFLLSWYGNVLAQQVLAHFVVMPWWIHSALSLIAGIYIPWLAYIYLERHQSSRWVRFTSFLLGQNFKKKKHPSSVDRPQS